MAADTTPRTKRENPLRYLFSKTWHYSEGNRRTIVWFWLMFIVAESANTFLDPLLRARIIDVITREGITSASVKTLSWLLGLLLVRACIFWGLHAPARVLEESNAFKARVNYRRYLLKGVMTMPLDWHAEHHSGDTIDKVNRGTNALHDFSESSFETIYAFVQLSGSFAMIAYFGGRAVCIVVVTMVVCMWIVMRFDKVLLSQYEELNHAENRIAESVFDAVSNISTVIILRVEKLVFGAIMRKVEKPYDLYVRSNRINEFKWFLVAFSCNIMTVAVLAEYFWQHFGALRGVSVGSVYILINYLDKITELLFKFAGVYGTMVRHKSRVTNSEELAKDFRAENFTNHVLPPDWRELAVRNLSFSYHGEGNGELHLEDVAFSLARGERIAFVGESGSGKTTLLKVMRDLYHPRSITLSVDGRVIPQGFEGISRAIALVPQNPEIFATTILENITLGAEYTHEFVEQFTDMACFTEVAKSLPKGFNSSIKEKGVNLSGGQQQRLALARGFLACHDKDIVLLDEPTSSLDTLNEMRIYENIFRAFDGKTIVSSIHRLHLLPLFHRMYFFSGGQIVASGTLDDLLRTCPAFKGLWDEYHKHGHETNGQQ